MENIILPEGYESTDNDNTNLVNELEKSTTSCYTEMVQFLIVPLLTQY